MNQPQHKIYLPIILLLSWLGLTLFTFFFGPYEYKLTNPAIFYIYLFFIHLALFMGYKRGQKSLGREMRNKFNYTKFIKVTIIVSLLYFVVKLIMDFGGDAQNFTKTFNDASNTYENSSLNNSNIFSYLDMLFGPISIIAITNTIFSYNNLPKRYKYSVYILIIFTIASSIGSATRSGIVQIAIISMAAFSLGIYKKNIILKYRHKVALWFFVISLVVGFLAYSSLLAATRGGGLIVNNPLTKEPPKEDFYLYKITSPIMHPLINNISFYISHSYYNLNQALNLPYKGLGFGLSNSYFIMNNVEKITGWSGLKDISYGVRLDKQAGIGGYGLYWSTFYTWIASDFTFPGTIVLIYIMGYFLSLALIDSINFPNPLSVTVFCTLFFFIFHFAFNNPLQDGRGLTTYLILPIIWLIFRRKTQTPIVQEDSKFK